jgi:hypothetical protein
MRDLGKPIENRKWPPPDYMLGQLVALHSGKHWDDDGATHIALHAHKALEDEDCPSGFITCVARLRGVMWDHAGRHSFIYHHNLFNGFSGKMTAETFDFPSPEEIERWFFGPYGWLMPERIPIAPVACRGAQRLWKLPPDVEAEVLRRYNESKGG